jgi:hypothetical protein
MKHRSEPMDINLVTGAKQAKAAAEKEERERIKRQEALAAELRRVQAGTKLLESSTRSLEERVGIVKPSFSKQPATSTAMIYKVRSFGHFRGYQSGPLLLP